MSPPLTPSLNIAPVSKPAIIPQAGLPRVSVVVVNYRQWEKTAKLVDQLSRSSAIRTGRAEVVIVDNHSPRHRLMHRLRRQPGVSLRRWNKNHGFARAVNEGCRLSQGEWFLLLNPDMTLSDGFLDQVLDNLEPIASEDPRLGIVGFHLRNSDGTRQLSTGPIPNFPGTLGRLLLPRRRRKYQNLRTDQRCQVDWVTGCCLLVRRECWEDLQGLDEDYFLYYEDVDLCLRARRQGWSVWYEPGLAVVHHAPLHNRSVPALLRVVTRHSLLVFAEKHWPRWQTRLLARLMKWEARLRRFWSWQQGDPHQARIFGEMERLIADCQAGRSVQARFHLEEIVQRVNLRIGV